jgi:ActR/RegA family two-component response regulator
MVAGYRIADKSILVVGGSHATLELLHLALSVRGFTVFVASTTAGARQLCRQHLPTLALIELDVSVSRNAHLLGELLRIHPDIRVCLMGSEGMAGPPAGFLTWQALGAAHFIAPPFSLAELCDTLDRLIAGAPLASGVASAPRVLPALTQPGSPENGTK